MPNESFHRLNEDPSNTAVWCSSARRIASDPDHIETLGDYSSHESIINCHGK